MSTAEFRSIHVWHRCHGCAAEPIIGRRYDCQTCPVGPDNHLCETCFARFERGAIKHPTPKSYSAHLNIARHTFIEFVGAPRDMFEPWLRVAERDVSPPTVPDRFVVRPEFCCRKESFFGAYAFVVDPDRAGSRLVMTALHVLDELVKNANVDCSTSNASYSGEELPRLVDRVNLYDVFGTKWILANVGSAASMLVLPNARMGEEEPYCQRDIAAFVADPSASLFAAPLAASTPDVGEPIWLAMNQGSGGRTRAAVVVEQTERTMIFRFASGSDGPPYTSGAPLMNRDGEVMGINVGRGALDGRHYGYANHVESIRRHLKVSDCRIVSSVAADVGS